MSKFRTAMITALATLAVAGPAAGLAEAAPNNGGGTGGGGTAKTCKYKNGSTAQPGDTMTHTRITTVKGRRFVARSSFICGEDGQWHEKA